MRVYSNLKNNYGFTLIEVLVASVILFSAIATVSLVYRGAFMSSEKATSHIRLTGMLPSILANVQQAIREQKNSSSTLLTGSDYAWNISYHWQATLSSFKSAPARFDAERGKVVQPPAKYKLWQVELTIVNDKASKIYRYSELSWLND